MDLIPAFSKNANANTSSCFCFLRVPCLAISSNPTPEKAMIKMKSSIISKPWAGNEESRNSVITFVVSSWHSFGQGWETREKAFLKYQKGHHTGEKFDEFSLSAMQGPINALRERLWVQMEQRMDPAGRLGSELAWECGTEQRDPALTLVGKMERQFLWILRFSDLEL